jgi:lipoate-protein ligase A
LAGAGVDGAVVHDGPTRSSPWSATVCFAGLGPGEVTVGGAKVVGISQRRSRAGALFQCGALLTWDPRPLVDVLAAPDGAVPGGVWRAEAAAALEAVAAGAGVARARLVAAFEGALHDA